LLDRYNEEGQLAGTVNYYLPAMSKIYSDRKDMFKFERLFSNREKPQCLTGFFFIIIKPNVIIRVNVIIIESFVATVIPRF